MWRVALFVAMALALGCCLGATLSHAETYVGDSIAYGAGHAAHQFTLAKPGMGSCWIDQRIPKPIPGFILADWIVVSAGVNDNSRCVPALRQKAGPTAKVIWIVPPKKYVTARRIILETGQRWRDHFVVFTPGRDGLHPRSYPELVQAIHATEGWAR